MVVLKSGGCRNGLRTDQIGRCLFKKGIIQSNGGGILRGLLKQSPYFYWFCIGGGRWIYEVRSGGVFYFLQAGSGLGIRVVHTQLIPVALFTKVFNIVHKYLIVCSKIHQVCPLYLTVQDRIKSPMGMGRA